MPPVYNENRLQEQPIPPFESSIAVGQDINIERAMTDSDSSIFELTDVTDEQNGQLEENIKPENIEDPEDLFEYEHLFDDEENLQHAGGAINVASVHSNLSTSFANGLRIESTRIEVNATDKSNDETRGENNVQKREIEENVQLLLKHGAKYVFDDEVEYLYMPGKTIKPFEEIPQYEVKGDDILCGKIPFKVLVIVFT